MNISNINNKYQKASYSLFILLLLPSSAGAVSCGLVEGSGLSRIDVTVTSDCTNLVTTNIETLSVGSGVTEKDEGVRRPPLTRDGESVLMAFKK